jgi:hypothetical protein
MEENNELFSKSIRSGKRTYFIDVRKATKTGDLFISITESKKRFLDEDGKFVYDKHKVFLYKEDFREFLEAMNNAAEFVKTEQPFDEEELKSKRRAAYEQSQNSNQQFSDISFEDLK